MFNFTPEQSSFLVLGALVAMLVVLVTFALFFATVGWKALRYASRFKGFQAGRNTKNEMTFTVNIDETPPPPSGPWFSFRWTGKDAPKRKTKRAPGLALDGQGHPIPARDLAPN